MKIISSGSFHYSYYVIENLDISALVQFLFVYPMLIILLDTTIAGYSMTVLIPV